MNHCDPSERLVSMRVTHRRATVGALEAAGFKDRAAAMRRMARLGSVVECAILQTCNRVEIIALSSGNVTETEADLEGAWFGGRQRLIEAHEMLETSTGADAVRHLLRVAAGLESMVIGEDEILRQVKAAYDEGSKAGTLGPVLDRIFQTALRVGKEVRTSTRIDRGAVSVGSVGVELLRESLGDLSRGKVLVIGAGEAGETVAKALSARKTGVVIVANRTLQKATSLAKELGGRALPFDSLAGALDEVDGVVVATSAPHYILTYKLMAQVMASRQDRPLLVVDLAEPRNVDLSVAGIPGLTLRNLDDLRGVMRAGIQKRLSESHRAERIVERGVGQALTAVKQDRVEPLVTSVFRGAEEIRKAEVEKAVARLKLGPDSPQREVVEDLSRSLVKRILAGPVDQMRESAANGELESVDAAEKLFGTGRPHRVRHPATPETN